MARYSFGDILTGKARNTPSLTSANVQGPMSIGPQQFYFPEKEKAFNPLPYQSAQLYWPEGGVSAQPTYSYQPQIPVERPPTGNEGPGGITPGSYPATSLTEGQRNWLWQYFGHSGPAPIGYGGEGKEEKTGIQPQKFDLSSSVNKFMTTFVDPISEALEKWRGKLEDFDKSNPFAFDEAQARASAQERFNPFYDAELNEFMTGIRRSSARSIEDQTRTIGELNVDASKLSERERLSTQEAIRSSEEGFAGAGLFFSGKRERATGLEEVGGLQKQEDIQTQLGRGTESAIQSNKRIQEDLALNEARQKRLIESSRTTALETDISKQKKEAQYRRGLERLQFAGDIPGSSPMERISLENQFFQNI